MTWLLGLILGEEDTSIEVGQHLKTFHQPSVLSAGALVVLDCHESERWGKRCLECLEKVRGSRCPKIPDGRDSYRALIYKTCLPSTGK